MKYDVVIIGGPTASGKSEIAVGLAELINGEIVNADSVQIYRELNIGTAKPPQDLRKRVPHHLIDVATILDPWDVKRYEKEALNTIASIRSRGKIPIVVGGSGFYIKSITDILPDDIPRDYQLRKELERFDSKELYDRLKKLDPDRARKIHPNDKKRLVRALEIFYLTGKKPSLFSYNKRHDLAFLKLAIVRNREVLKKRIYSRVDRMMELGWLDEVKDLLSCFPHRPRILVETLGYRELIAYLDGLCDIETAVKLIKNRTYKYAVKQIRWFKREGFKFIYWEDELCRSFLQRIKCEILTG